jgi:hypothetical protein
MKAPLVLVAVALVTVFAAASAEEKIQRFEIPCGLTKQLIVERAAEVFGRSGCRIVTAYPELGQMTAEFIGSERDFYSPTTFHLALVGDTLHVTVYRIATISGGQEMYRDVESSVANPILAELTKIAKTPLDGR